jgi:hypothetical protein
MSGEELLDRGTYESVGIVGLNHIGKIWIARISLAPALVRMKKTDLQNQCLW